MKQLNINYVERVVLTLLHRIKAEESSCSQIQQLGILTNTPTAAYTDAWEFSLIWTEHRSKNPKDNLSICR